MSKKLEPFARGIRFTEDGRVQIKDLVLDLDALRTDDGEAYRASPQAVMEFHEASLWGYGGVRKRRAVTIVRGDGTLLVPSEGKEKAYRSSAGGASVEWLRALISNLRQRAIQEAEAHPMSMDQQVMKILGILILIGAGFVIFLGMPLAIPVLIRALRDAL